MGDFVRKSTSSWIRPASPTPREGVSIFFNRNRFPPTRPKTYPKHSSQLLLSAENEHSKEGPQKSANAGKNCDDHQGKRFSISRLDSCIRTIKSNRPPYLINPPYFKSLGDGIWGIWKSDIFCLRPPEAKILRF